MRFYISVDAEGISGVHKLTQVIPGKPEYNTIRKLMAGDVNAAVRGALRAGATEIVVNDTHNYGDNLLISDLDRHVTLLSGADKPLIMAEGLQERFDAMALVGYHSKKGQRGVVSHTFFFGAIFEAKINGKPFGEADFVAHMGGFKGTPMVLLTGDDQVTTQGLRDMPGLRTVAVKSCIGNGSAGLRHPDITAAEIEEAAYQAVLNAKHVKPLTLEGDVELEILFSTATQAGLACTFAGFIGDQEVHNRVRYVAKDYGEAYMAFMHALRLGAYYRDDT